MIRSHYDDLTCNTDTSVKILDVNQLFVVVAFMDISTCMCTCTCKCIHATEIMCIYRFPHKKGISGN